MRAKIWIVLAAGLSLQACSMLKPYHRPDHAQPAGWRDTPQAAAPAPSADWWTSFGSAPLDAMMAEAAKGNLDIAAAAARIRQADAQVRISGASLLPALSGGASIDRTKSPVSTTGKSNISNTYNANLSASYEFDFWGKNAATVESAKASARASRFDHQVVILTTQASVAATYFDMIGTQDRLKSARESLRESEELLAAERDRFKLGTATDLDVAQQESVVASARAAIPPLDQQIRQDANALAVLIGRAPQDVAVDLGTLEAVKIPAVGPGLPSTLLERRPDIREAEADLMAANANIGNARAQFLPDFSLTGELGLESATLSRLLNPASQLASIGASVLQPIFSGGQLEGNLELTRAQYEELVATYRKSVLSAYQDVENALVAVRKTAEEEAAQRAAVATAARAYHLATDQMVGGVTDITTVLNTERTLFSAQDALAQARLAHIQAIVSLYKALGGGWNGQV
jgi:NodT family efflux transporter outer membrane factor (OMF) lipoprotein